MNSYAASGKSAESIESADCDRRAFLLGPGRPIETELSSYAGQTMEFHDAPTTVVGGGWESQFNRACDRRLWSIEDEMAACRLFNVSVMDELLALCQVSRTAPATGETTTVTITTPTIQMAKVVASSLILIKVWNLEPAVPEDKGKLSLLQVRLGRYSVLLSRTPDSTTVGSALADSVDPNHVVAVSITYNNTKIGAVWIKHIMYPSLHVISY